MPAFIFLVLVEELRAPVFTDEDEHPSPAVRCAHHHCFPPEGDGSSCVCMHRRVCSDKIKQFMAFTSTREEFATRVLERCRWDVDYAVNWFLTSEQASGAGSHRVDVKAIERLYEKYKGACARAAGRRPG